MGRTACTEPQCLYKGDLYLFSFTLHIGWSVPASAASGSAVLGDRVPEITEAFLMYSKALA